MAVRSQNAMPASRILALLLFALVVVGAGAGHADASRSEKLRIIQRMQNAAIFYRENCAVCHGETGKGDGEINVPKPPDFTSPDAVARLTAGMMIRATRAGHGKEVGARWAQRNDAEVADVVRYIRETFMLPAPSGDASLGRSIFARTCSVCHGDHGNGASWARYGLNPPPFDFTSDKGRALSRLHMINAVKYGRANTAMVGFATQLSDNEIAAVVDYVRATFMRGAQATAPAVHGGEHQHQAAIGGRQPHAHEPPALPSAGHHGHHGEESHEERDFSLPFPGGVVGDIADGKRLFEQNCTACHGMEGKGNGPRAYFMAHKPANFTGDEAREELNRPHLFKMVSHGVIGTEMPAWSKVLSDQQIADVAEYVFITFVQPARASRDEMAPKEPMHPHHDDAHHEPGAAKKK